MDGETFRSAIEPQRPKQWTEATLAEFSETGQQAQEARERILTRFLRPALHCIMGQEYPELESYVVRISVERP